MDKNGASTPSADSIHSSDEAIEEVLQIVNRLAKLTHTGQFIFRGEPECFKHVSSSLYRQFQDMGLGDQFNAEEIQNGILDRAKAYTDETDELQILSQLQHYGGKTNLIDFTTNYLIALFFACYGSPSKDARIVLVEKHGPMSAYIKEPRRTANRVIAQHSVFVLPPRGFIEQFDVVEVPSQAKQPTLNYLRNSHGIYPETIFNDLLGFIWLENVRYRARAEIKLGFTSVDKGDFQEAIEHYSTAIELNLQIPHAYTLRGNVYRGTGEVDSAIRDYDQAIIPFERESAVKDMAAV